MPGTKRVVKASVLQQKCIKFQQCLIIKYVRLVGVTYSHTFLYQSYEPEKSENQEGRY